MDVPTLPQVVYENDGTSTKTNFETPLGYEWNYLRNRRPSNYVLQGGGLTLIAGPESIDSDGAPTWVGRRQQHKNFVATTVVSLSGKADGDEAGMSLYMKCYTHYDLSIVRRSDGKACVRLRYKLGELEHIEKEVAVGGRNVSLRIEGSPEFYKFSYSLDGKTFSPLGRMNTRFISSEAGGGFTGAYIALYSQNAKRGGKSSALFSRFEYKGL